MSFRKDPTKSIYYQEAQKFADEKTKHCQAVVEEIYSFYRQTSLRGSNHNVFISVSEDANEKWNSVDIDQLSFTHNLTWSKWKTNCDLVKQTRKFESISHNKLAIVMLMEDVEFLAYMEDLTKDPLGGELLLLGAQRLKRMLKEFIQPQRCRRLLTKIYTKSPESVLFFHDDQLKKEVINLFIFAKENPHSKIIWLGSQHFVNAKIEEMNDKVVTGTYLLCEDNKWTWMLNRLWLLIAVELGYEVRLIEQQYPKVTQALLSGDICAYISELLNEIRPSTKIIYSSDGSVKNEVSYTSQYSTDYEPTATAQEVLALMELGCLANKNVDGSIGFFKSNINLSSENSPKSNLKHPLSHSDEVEASASVQIKHPLSHSDDVRFSVQPRIPKLGKLGKPSDYFAAPKESCDLRLGFLEETTANQVDSVSTKPTDNNRLRFFQNIIAETQGLDEDKPTFLSDEGNNLIVECNAIKSGAMLKDGGYLRSTIVKKQ